MCHTCFANNCIKEVILSVQFYDRICSVLLEGAFTGNTRWILLVSVWSIVKMAANCFIKRDKQSSDRNLSKVPLLFSCK